METIRRLFQHSNWANQRLVNALKEAGDENEQAKRFLFHILYSEQVWLARLRGIDSSNILIWTEGDLSTCAELAIKNEADYADYFRTLDDKDLDERITYRNQTGREYQTSVRDILTHVAFHGQYHRGQINLQLRKSGLEPVNVDFITYVRGI